VSLIVVGVHLPAAMADTVGLAIRFLLPTDSLKKSLCFIVTFGFA
jgi:hypothetical protein